MTSSYEVISSSPRIIAMFARLSSLYSLISTKFNRRMHLEFRGCSCSCVVHKKMEWAHALLPGLPDEKGLGDVY